MKRLSPLFRIFALCLLLAASGAACWGVYVVVGDAVVMPLMLALFGAWSLLCVRFGASMRGDSGPGPLPLMSGEDVAKWIATGETPGEVIEDDPEQPPQEPRHFEM